MKAKVWMSFDVPLETEQVDPEEEPYNDPVRGTRTGKVMTNEADVLKGREKAGKDAEKALKALIKEHGATGGYIEEVTEE